MASEAGREVAIREVGPRDGFQNEPEVLATDDKVRLVEMLARTGVPRLEVTSFVRPDVVPQLADGAEVLRRARIPDGVAVTVLIPKERGLDNAQEREPLDRGVAVGARTGGGARPRRGAPRRGRHLHLVRVSLRGPRTPRAGVWDRGAARGGRLRRDRVRRHDRDGEPRTGPGVLRGRAGAPAGRRADGA